VDWITYDTWGVISPDGGYFPSPIGPGPFKKVLKRFGGLDAQQQVSDSPTLMIDVQIRRVSYCAQLRSGPGANLCATQRA
jgi:hypothetical protein